MLKMENKGIITSHLDKAIEFKLSDWYFFCQLRLLVEIVLFDFRMLHYLWFYFPGLLYVLFNLFIDLIQGI